METKQRGGVEQSDLIRLLRGDSTNITRGGEPIIVNYRVKLFGECCDYGTVFARLTND